MTGIPQPEATGIPQPEDTGVPQPEDMRSLAGFDGSRYSAAAPGEDPVTMHTALPGTVVGLVIGTVPATPLRFSVGLAPGQYLQLDDVVVTSRELPGQGRVQVAGVVTDLEAVHEGARFASDVFLIQQGALPAEVCEVAEVTVTRVEPEIYIPPLPGAAVARAQGQQRDSALYFDEMGAAGGVDEGGSPGQQRQGAGIQDALGLGGQRQQANEDLAAAEQSRQTGRAGVARQSLDCPLAAAP